VGAARVPSSVLLGANYTHHAFPACRAVGTGILATLHEAGVLETVHAQLGAMRRAGLGSLRLILWHMTDVPRQGWGVVPSRGGRLPEPFRGNLIAYLSEARRYGFERVTVAFGPQWSNSPLSSRWDPDRFGENWAFIRDVRALVEEHGPPDGRLDLLNEGAPSAHLPPDTQARLSDYVGRMWAAYARAFGTEGATVSTIAPRSPRDRGDRLGNLIDALSSRNVGLPAWFEIHLNYEADGARHGLHQADSVLSARGLAQPLTVGETAYDDAGVAAVFQSHRSESPRWLDEVVPWYLRAGDDCPLPPPYDPGAYHSLGGSAPSP
jgi:hypothetical protein